MFDPRHHTTQARFLVAFFFGAVLTAAAIAPLMAAHGRRLVASILYLLLAPVCHQRPARSFALAGLPWGLCQRCCGLYLGIFAAALSIAAHWVESTPVPYRRAWAVGATAVLAADAVFPYVSSWTNTPFSRFTSGLLFGAMVGSLLVPALAELLARWQGRRGCSALPDPPSPCRVPAGKDTRGGL